MSHDEHKIISGYRFRISEAWEASFICEQEIKFPRYTFLFIQFWLLHYSIELSYRVLLLANNIPYPPNTHKLRTLHNLLADARPQAAKVINLERIDELGKYGDTRGGIRYPETFPAKWEHTRTMWDDLKPFKDYALNQTYISGEVKDS